MDGKVKRGPGGRDQDWEASLAREAGPGPGGGAWPRRAACVGVVRAPEGRLRWPRRLNRVGELEYSGTSKRGRLCGSSALGARQSVVAILAHPFVSTFGSKGYVL